MKMIGQKGVKNVKDVALGSKAKFRSVIAIIPHNKIQIRQSTMATPFTSFTPFFTNACNDSSEGVGGK